MPNIKNIVIGAVILVALYGGYTYFSGGTSDVQDPGVLSSQGDPNIGTSPDGNDPGQEFLAILLNLKTIKLDQGIFNSNSFTHLQDFTRVIAPATNVGRPNPFAPIGTDPQTVSVPAASVSASAINSLPSVASAQVDTKDASAILSTSATLNGALLKAATNTNRFFEWGTNLDSLSNTTPLVSQKTSGVFNRQITGLLPSTTYYFRAVATTGVERAEGDILVFTTNP
mgnify:FL=1